MVKLNVVQDNDATPRMDSCAACVYSRKPYGVMRCDAFAGRYAEDVRQTYQLTCPGYVPKATPIVSLSQPPGWLKRWVLRVWRWIW
jgi:hypothetical protein